MKVNAGLVGCGIAALFFAFLGVVGLGMYVSTSNQEVELRSQFKAQDKVLETVFDNTWKILENQAGVSSKYEKTFKEVYPAMIKSRNYGGELMKWVTEHNPEFKTTLYEKLMDSIEIQRTKFINEEKKAIDIKREHDNLRNKIPSSFFVGSRPELELRLVTSDRTTEAFETGKDNDVNLFKD